MIHRFRRSRVPQGGRLASLGQDFDRGHREYVANLTPGNKIWLRTKPFRAPPNYELPTSLRTFAHVVEQLQLGLRAQVLDVGCGPGWLSEFLARCGYWVTGVDISDDMVEIARERVAAIPGPVAEGIEVQAEFHALPVREMPWENRFDAAVLYDTMHHFDDEVETLRVILRALVPGGAVYIREGVKPVPGSEDERNLVTEMEQYGTLESPFDPEYLRWSVKEAGFVDVRHFMEVDRLVPLDDAGAAMGIFTTWAKIRAGRRKPETNTLIARKPVADTDGEDAWRASISVAAPPAEAEDGSLHILIHVENTGRAYWPAPTSFPYPEGIVNVAPYLLVDDERVELPRVTLPHSLPTGGAVTVALIVPAEHRGRDEVLVDLVRERLGWFSEPASPIARVRLA
ncbi:MAG TPA: class I SAM-dependent methyltransferase [Gaiellaceae bacterium]|nr:class I SAM-dependent methyltransferase [Gaiellaceae bacterium]